MTVRLKDCSAVCLSLAQLAGLTLGLTAMSVTSPAFASSPTADLLQAMPSAGTSTGQTVIAQNTVSGVLQLNDSGDAVSALQARLTELGYYSGPVSGFFGSQTEAAVLRFQEARGLTADGIAGPATQEALQQTANSASTEGSSTAAASPNDGILQEGDTGPEVSELQQRLRSLGFYQGEADGVFGPQTAAAVVGFQRSQGIVTDGIVGTTTAVALQNPTTATAPDQPTTAATTSAPASSEQTAASNSFPAPSGPEVTASAPAEALPFADTSGKFSVLELQWALRQRGFYTGPIDGVMGPATRQAIYDAQRAYGLSESDLSSGPF